MRRPVDLTPGSTFAGRFRVGRLLTSRRHTKVHAAEEATTGRPVALEVTTTAVARDFAEHLAGCLDRALTVPPHPNLIAVVAHGVDPVTSAGWAATDLVAGPTLVELVKPGPVPAPRAVALTLGLLAGLEARSGAGRPQLIEAREVQVEGAPPKERARVRLVGDWAAGYPGFTGDAVPGEASPLGCLPAEVLDDVRNATPASAVYTAAGCLYLLLTGRPPISGRTTLDTMRKVLGGAAPEPPSALAAGVPAALDAVVLRALAREPARRFADPKALASALTAAAFA